MADDTLRAQLWNILKAEPKPITEARVLELADANLPKLKAEQFRQWFESNGSVVLGQLNG